MEDTGATPGEAGGVLAVEALARGLDADDLDPRIVEEGMEQADGVRAAAEGGDQHVGKEALRLENLFERLDDDHRLEVAVELGRAYRKRVCYGTGGSWREDVGGTRLITK